MALCLGDVRTQRVQWFPKKGLQDEGLRAEFLRSAVGKLVEQALEAKLADAITSGKVSELVGAAKSA
jgi:hypothetical protein